MTTITCIQHCTPHDAVSLIIKADEEHRTGAHILLVHDIRFCAMPGKSEKVDYDSPLSALVILGPLTDFEIKTVTDNWCSIRSIPRGEFQQLQGPLKEERDVLKKMLEDLVYWKFTRNQRAQMKLLYGAANPYERACKLVGKA